MSPLARTAPTQNLSGPGGDRRAIRLNKKEFEKAGLAMSGQNGSDVHVSPMAGKTPFLVQANSRLDLHLGIVPLGLGHIGP